MLRDQDQLQVSQPMSTEEVALQAFASLQASERRYRDLFYHLPIGLALLDASNLVQKFKDLRALGVTDLSVYINEHPEVLMDLIGGLEIEEVNQHIVGMFGGNSAHEMLGPIAHYWTPSLPTIQRSLEARYRGESYFEEETRVRRLDGHVIDVLFSTARHGAIANKSLVSFLDISHRKADERALRKSEQIYRDLFNHIPIALFQNNSSGLLKLLSELRSLGVTDLAKYIASNPDFVFRAMETTYVEQVNESAVRLLGAQDRHELLEALKAHRTSSPEAYGRILEARYSGKEVHAEEVKIKTLDGRQLQGVMTVAFPPAFAGLGITLSAFVDSTETKRAQERLQKVEADFSHAARVSMLGELTASIAHEVNQPLAAITTNAEAAMRWLNRVTPDIDEVRELTKSIAGDARRAAEIVARVRSMASPQTPDKAEVSLDDVVHEALTFLRHEIQRHAVHVAHHQATVAPHVLADRTQLQQVIVNLAVNAMQAMVDAAIAERRIVIRTIAEDDRVKCTIEDSGPGIGQEHLSRLFDSFYTTKKGGMGMGLSLCRSIIEAHGGQIQADNAAHPRGARLTLILPSIVKA
jgi:signal transduction histidine kinase/PAS domain-containing protein